MTDISARPVGRRSSETLRPSVVDAADRFRQEMERPFAEDARSPIIISIELEHPASMRAS